MAWWWLCAIGLAQPDFEDFADRLHAAVRKGDDAVVTAAWAEMLSRQPDPDGRLLATLRTAMRGHRKAECRASRCQLRYTKADGKLTIEFAQIDGRWQVHDPAWALERFEHQVTASLTVRGAVAVTINGTPTFLLGPVRDTTALVSMLNDALVVGANTLTLTPEAGEAEVDLRLHAWPKDAGVVDTAADGLVSWVGTLAEPRTFAFSVE